MGHLKVEIDPFYIEIPGSWYSQDSEELKEWIWSHFKAKFLAGMSLREEENNQTRHKLIPSDSLFSWKGETKNKTSLTRPIVSQEQQLKTKDTEARLKLLDAITYVQRQFLQSEGPMVAFDTLLVSILNLLDAGYGFIGEVGRESDGKEFLICHTWNFSEKAWSEVHPEAKGFFTANVKPGAKFYNMHSLFGEVITSNQPVISNDPVSDKRRCGIPPGHPNLDNFLGLPFFNNENTIIGMVGIANQPGGFSQDDVKFLAPLTVTCSNLIQAYSQTARIKDLINTLEENVKERTCELQLANDNLAEANRQIIKASAEQLEHFACMSHEIRTPLNCIIGLSSLMLQSDLSPQQEDSMKMIVNSGDLLLNVVNDVLDYSKLQSGHSDINISSCILPKIFGSTIHAIETKARNSNLGIATFYDFNIPQNIHTDERRLQEILYNLLGNAVKFSHSGSVIEVSAKLINTNKRQCPNLFDEAKIEEKLPESAENILRFTVKNYGRGIETENLESIFQPFHQTQSQADQVLGGTGLGLAITSKIVQAMGGNISVDSAFGEWAEFVVDLPFMDEPVDPQVMSSGLETTTVVFIGDSKATCYQTLCGGDHCPCHNAAISTLDHYNIDHVKFSDMTEVETFFSNNSKMSTNRSYVFFVQEEVYCERMSIFVGARRDSVLCTFGPNFTVSESAFHIKCFAQVMPSAFVEEIQRIVRNMKYASVAEMSDDSIRNDMSTIQKLRVLVAEDNIINQKVVIRMLQRLGVKNITVVDNGLKAVELEKAEEFDVILMDMQMPVMDGIQACRLIVEREEGNRPKPAIIFATAHVSSRFEAECIDAGASGYLAKPYTVAGIQESLTNHMQETIRCTRQ